MTGQEAINRALRLIGRLPIGQTPSAAETADALMALNAMLTRWEANGLSMGFSPLSAAGDTLPVPAEVEEAVAYNLAVRLSPEYGYPVSIELAAVAEEGLRALQRDAIVTPRIDTGLPRSGRFDIMSGDVV